MNDPRFAAMHTAPIFKKIRKEKFETQVDDRFKDLLTDERFSLGGPKQGAKGGKKPSDRKHKAEHGDAEEEAEEEVTSRNKKPTKGKSDTDTKESRLDYLTKLSRGEISGSSSENSSDEEAESSGSDGSEEDRPSRARRTASSDSSSSDEEDDVDSDYGLEGGALEIPGEEARGIGTIEDATKRIAIQNCDWNSLKAEDLMVILQSFCSPGMVVHSVTVYPSDFGTKRMEEEALHGPPKEIWQQTEEDLERARNDVAAERAEAGESSDEEEEEDETGSDSESEEDGSGSEEGNDSESDGSESHGDEPPNFQKPIVVKPKKSKSKKDSALNEIVLRAYELSKLRYYFAVAVCDSPRTAEALYQQLDGVEFEHSAMVFDLRFVPDDISFTDRKVRDECRGNVRSNYKPPDFIVKALQHTRVECTWDLDEEPERTKTLTNISMWRQLHASDLQQYLADSDNSDDEDDPEIQRKTKDMRKLLLGEDSDAEETGKDDFFLDDNREAESSSGEAGVTSKKSKTSGKKGGDDEEVDGEMTFTFVPGIKEDLELKKMQKRAASGLETVEEARERKKRERKLRLQQEREATGDGGHSGSDAEGKSSRSAKEKGKSDAVAGKEKSKKQGVLAKDEKDRSELSARASEDEEDFDMRALVKERKDKEKKEAKEARKKRKRSAASGENAEDESSHAFKVDTQDPRFFSLLQSNSNFGIDPMSSEFKATEGMKIILQEQRRLRQQEEERAERELRERTEASVSGSAQSASLSTVQPLVGRLKNKFSNKKQKVGK